MWDDTDIVSWTSAGGRCIGWEEREQMLASNPDLEEVVVRLSNDGNVSGECWCQRRLLLGCQLR